MSAEGADEQPRADDVRDVEDTDSGWIVVERTLGSYLPEHAKN
jgi:hypothetical protein